MSIIRVTTVRRMSSPAGCGIAGSATNDQHLGIFFKRIFSPRVGRMTRPRLSEEPLHAQRTSEELPCRMEHRGEKLWWTGAPSVLASSAIYRTAVPRSAKSTAPIYPTSLSYTLLIPLRPDCVECRGGEITKSVFSLLQHPQRAVGEKRLRKIKKPDGVNR
jgi:hypothetical protein